MSHIAVDGDPEHLPHENASSDHNLAGKGLNVSFLRSSSPVRVTTLQQVDGRHEPPVSVGNDTTAAGLTAADGWNDFFQQQAGHSRKCARDGHENSNENLQHNKEVASDDDDDDDAFEAFDPFGVVIHGMNDSFVVPGSSSWSLVNDDADDLSSSPDSGASHYTSADAAMDYLLFGESKRILAMKSGGNKHDDDDNDNNNDIIRDQRDTDLLLSSGETAFPSNHFSEQSVKQLSVRTTWDESFTPNSFAIACSAAKEQRMSDDGAKDEESQTHDCQHAKDFEKFYCRVPSLDESLDTNDSIDDPTSDDSGCCDDGTLLLKPSWTPSSSATTADSTDSSSTTTKPRRRLLNAVMKRQPRDMAKRPVPLPHYSYFVHMAHRVLFPASVMRAASTMGSWRAGFAASFASSKASAQPDTMGAATF